MAYGEWLPTLWGERKETESSPFQALRKQIESLFEDFDQGFVAREGTVSVRSQAGGFGVRFRSGVGPAGLGDCQAFPTSMAIEGMAIAIRTVCVGGSTVAHWIEATAEHNRRPILINADVIAHIVQGERNGPTHIRILGSNFASGKPDLLVLEAPDVLLSRIERPN